MWFIDRNSKVLEKEDKAKDQLDQSYPKEHGFISFAKKVNKTIG